jgi:hypothetical protein
LASGWLSGRKPFHADGLAGWIAPAFEVGRAGPAINVIRRKAGWNKD